MIIYYHEEINFFLYPFLWRPLALSLGFFIFNFYLCRRIGSGPLFKGSD